MKKVYILEDLDCAHCAALIEEEVGKLEEYMQKELPKLKQMAAGINVLGALMKE